MIRAAIVCSDPELASQLQEALVEFQSRIGVARVLNQYPNEAKLSPFLNAAMPELIFLSAEHPDYAADVAERILAINPGTPIIAFDRNCDGATMLKVLRAGAKDFLPAPFEKRVMAEMLARVESKIVVGGAISGHLAPVFGFLPAKAGAGATTLAVNTSLALARRPNTKTLLVDLD